MPLPKRSEFLAAQQQQRQTQTQTPEPVARPAQDPARVQRASQRQKQVPDLATMFPPASNPPKPRKNEKVPGPFAMCEPWNLGRKGGEPTIGLGNEAKPSMTPEQARATAQHVRLRERDLQIFRLLTKYRFATEPQIQRHLGVTSRMRRRMLQLEEAGFVRQQVLTAGHTLWVTTKLGMEAVGMGDYETQAGSIRYSAVAHTLGLVNIGSDLETGKMDPGWLPPALSQNPAGEVVVHDRDIAASYRQKLAFHNGDPRALRNAYLDEWGTEPWTYVLHGNAGTRTPDMVVERGGKGRDIAIELELSPKSKKQYVHILTTYKNSPYAAVVYLTDSNVVRGKMSSALKEVGPIQKLHVGAYAPIHSNENIFG